MDHERRSSALSLALCCCGVLVTCVPEVTTWSAEVDRESASPGPEPGSLGDAPSLGSEGYAGPPRGGDLGLAGGSDAAGAAGSNDPAGSGNSGGSAGNSGTAASGAAGAMSPVGGSGGAGDDAGPGPLDVVPTPDAGASEPPDADAAAPPPLPEPACGGLGQACCDSGRRCLDPLQCDSVNDGVCSPCASLTPLGFTDAWAVSADGRVVVGSTTDPALPPYAVRWTLNSGIQTLGSILGGALQSKATGVSADGNVVVGDAVDAAQQILLFRWSSDRPNSIVPRVVPNAGGGSQTQNVSGDGRFAVGTVLTQSGSQAFRWGATLELFDSPLNSAYAASFDGSVIVGETDTGPAFRWSAPEGSAAATLIELQPVRPFTGATAFGTNSSASVIVGFADGPVRWRSVRDFAPEELGEPDVPSSYQALDTSEDGSVIVGGEDAFVWTANDGLQSLLEVLVAAGVPVLDQWQSLATARSISADGVVVVGQGYDALGTPAAFRATLGDVACLPP